MIIECEHCRAKYQYDEERFERKPSKKIRCAKCQQIFEIKNPAFADKATPKPDPSESTVVGRRKTVEEMLPPELLSNPIEESTANAPIPGSGGTPGLRLPPHLRLSLAIIDGPDSGKVFRIEKARVVIGRSNADLVLNDIESSRGHACVEVRDSLVTVSDLGSTNGTIVNGDKITGQVELNNHSEFQIGSTTLMLIVTDAE